MASITFFLIAAFFAYAAGAGVYNGHCGRDNGGCQQLCEPSYNGRECGCNPEFVLHEDGFSCIEVDKASCDVDNGGCQHTCAPAERGVKCSCKAGYLLEFYGKTCIDINECSTSNGGCGPEKCVNLPGSYKCQEICSANNGRCSQKCEDVEGGVKCSCKSGYQLTSDSKICEDIDECASDNGGCDFKKCINSVGSFKCVQTCSFANGGCQHDCAEEKEDAYGKYDAYGRRRGGHHRGSGRADPIVTCSCKAGYQLGDDKRSCEDIDECATNQGGCVDTKCVNTVGSFQCVQSCDIKNGGCEQECTGPDGAVQCVCKEGFKLAQDGLGCEDVDECGASPPVCGDLTCINSIGSYQCKHPCAEDHGGCEHDCRAQKGEAVCSCKHGYKLGEDKKSCEEDAYGSYGRSRHGSYGRKRESYGRTTTGAYDSHRPYGKRESYGRTTTGAYDSHR